MTWQQVIGRIGIGWLVLWIASIFAAAYVRSSGKQSTTIGRYILMVSSDVAAVSMELWRAAVSVAMARFAARIAPPPPEATPVPVEIPIDASLLDEPKKDTAPPTT